MNIDFSNAKVKKQFSSKSELEKAFGLRAVKIWQRFSFLKYARNLAVIRQITMLNCIPIGISFTGSWRLNVTSNCTLIFKIDHNPIPTDNNGEIYYSLVTNIQIIGIV